MHDIWNPWHGCVRVSEGCAHCYMFTMDAARGLDGGVVRRNKTTFDYPLQRTRDGAYKVRSGELIRICMNSDFLIEQADPWRDEVWGIIHARPDVRFFILTKRPERFAECLPPDWGDGWDNVMLNVTCENQRRADERIPILLATPAKHKGIMCAPFIGPVRIDKYLAQGQIEQVICGGENYDGARPCHFEWVQALRADCVRYDTRFCFIETGSVFVKDGRTYHLPNKRLQSEMAYKSGMNFQGRPIHFRLTDIYGRPIPESSRYTPHYGPQCTQCASKLICNGCTNCGECMQP